MRDRCQTCGLVMHRGHHYGSLAVCARLGKAEAEAQAARAQLTDLLPENDALRFENRNLRAESAEWKRIAHVETKGNACAWKDKYDEARAEIALLTKEAESHEAELKLAEAEVEQLREQDRVLGEELIHWRRRAQEQDAALNKAEAQLAKVVPLLEEILAKSTVGQWFHVLAVQALAAAKEKE